MEFLDYEIDEYLETGGNPYDFEKGNGMWWQNLYYSDDGYGYGYKDDFTTLNNEFHRKYLYDVNLLWK